VHGASASAPQSWFGIALGGPRAAYRWAL